jgi:hypothetical protein
VQVIDDESGNTIASASSLEDEIRNKVQGTDKKSVSAVVGEAAANRTKQKGVQTVVFDRQLPSLFHEIYTLPDQTPPSEHLSAWSYWLLLLQPPLKHFSCLFLVLYF